MHLHMPSLVTLVPERPCCVLYETRCQIYWALTHFFLLLVLWFDITQAHEQRHTAHAGGIVCTPPFLLGGGGLDRTSTFRGGLLGKRGWLFSGGLQFSQKKLIFNDKKMCNDKKLISKNIFLCHN